MKLDPWASLAIFGAMITGVCIVMIAMSRLIGPRRLSASKLEPYECGVPLLDDTKHRFSVRFYVLAILFILFDIEIVFLIPWVLVARGWLGFLEMAVFVAILGFGLFYAWMRGSLEWD